MSIYTSLYRCSRKQLRAKPVYGYLPVPRRQQESGDSGRNGWCRTFVITIASLCTSLLYNYLLVPLSWNT